MVVQDYSKDILGRLCEQAADCKGFLSEHAITAGLRSKMVDWMIEVLSSYKMTEETFFRAVRLMDAFLAKAPRQELKDLHLIGVTAMFSAAKYEEIHPLKLNVVFDKIARKKFRKAEILEKESEIVNCLGFRLEAVTAYDVARHAIGNSPLTQRNCVFRSPRLRSSTSRRSCSTSPRWRSSARNSQRRVPTSSPAPSSSSASRPSSRWIVQLSHREGYAR
ncbi:unnamed protein product [Sphagnum balticum]